MVYERKVRMQNKISFRLATILAIELLVRNVCIVAADAAEEEVRLRIKVAQNDLCARNDLTDDQIKAIQQCPDFKAYEVINSSSIAENIQ